MASAVSRPRVHSLTPTLLLPLLICPIACLAQEPEPNTNYVVNGGFEDTAADGWIQGWERILETADAEVEVTSAQANNACVRITGGTQKSRGGLKAPLRVPDEVGALRVQVTYRDLKGKSLIIVQEAGLPEDEEPIAHRIELPSARQWRPGGGMVTLVDLGLDGLDLEILLLHEGPGETWFDNLLVAPGMRQTVPGAVPGTGPDPGSAPALGAPTVGPYVTQWHPVDGAESRVNPPRFRWPVTQKATYTVEWSRSADFPPADTQKIEGLEPNVYIPARALEPGTWFWRVSAASAGGPAGGPFTTPGPLHIESDEDLDDAGDDAPPAEETEDETEPEDTPEPPDEESTQEPVAQVTADGEPVDEPDPEEVPDEAEEESPPTGPDPGPTLPTSAPGGIQATPPRLSVSPTRSFRIEKTAAVALVPTVDAVIADLPPHPRVWLDVDTVLEVRGRAAGPLNAEWEAFLARLEGAKGGELPEEPKGRGKWRNPSPKQLATNQEILEVALGESALVRDLAFAGAIAGEESLTQEAKRRALHLAGWDPEGATGYVSHDQAFREILLSLALTVDWLGASPSEEEKQTLVDAVSKRGSELHKRLSSPPRPLNAFPYSSHGQTAVGFLTIAGLAVAGDVPAAEEWLRFAFPVAVGMFSPWAGDDGGWLQGETYWKRSAPFTFQLFDALKTAAGTDLYALPWTRNTAHYKAAMHPPYSRRGAFGDGPEEAPGTADRLAMWRLASVNQDPVAAWYAESINAAGEPTAFDFMWRDPAVKGAAPTGTSVQFPDSGLFAMHSAVSDPAGIHLYGRASGFGSFNHAHADQGHFSLDAFGEPLLIDAGYYDWYRSPHGTSFSRTSLAHNVILVDGKTGQREGDITAGGKLEDFLGGPHVDYVRVEIAEAYPEALLDSCTRHFVYLRPSWFVIWDHVEAPQKVSLTWLLHSLEQPETDAEAGTGLIRGGAASLAVGLFGSDKTQWSSNPKFAKNPRFTQDDIEAPPQWHTSVKGRTKAQTHDAVMLLAPFQGEAGPELRAVEAEGGIAAEGARGEERVVALVRQGETEAVTAGDLKAGARMVALLSSDEGDTVFALGLTSLERAGTPLITSTVPALVAGRLGEAASLTFGAEDEATVALAVPAQPDKVLVDGEGVESTWADGLLTVTVPRGRHKLELQP